MRRRTIKYCLISLSIGLFFIVGYYIYLINKYQYHARFCKELSLSLPQLCDFFGGFNDSNELLLSLICEADKQNWDKVLHICEKYPYKHQITSYYYNLANAKKSQLSDKLMDYYQPFERGLILSPSEKSSLLEMIASSDLWYHLGAQTMAEHNAMIAMIFSPAQGGKYFYRKLAKINLAAGDSLAAGKYISLLGEVPKDDYASLASFKPKEDKILLASQHRELLQLLVQTQPNNIAAYEYLLCYDLMFKEIGAFIEDYVPGRKHSRLFEEAALIWMASGAGYDPKIIEDFQISEQCLEDFNEYTRIYLEDKGKASRLKNKYSNTYWYFYHYAKRNE